MTTFLELHHGDRPLLQPNAWDAGSAKLLAALGFQAIATTSSGFAATLGRLDGSVTRDELLAHCRHLVAAVDIPVAADGENGYADDPAGVAATIDLARDTGLAGFSIEDFTGHRDDPIYDAGLARDRIAAAADAAGDLVLTARCENYLHGRRDLDDTIARLQAYQEAGADVLFAPGVVQPDELRALVSSVDRPVNVLALPGCPPVDELAAIGVARVSIGGAFAYAALAAAVEFATELRDAGTYSWWERVGGVRATILEAFGD
jgi:2-methylisocitrate lyase-like PEP mutase family enzyme